MNNVKNVKKSKFQDFLIVILIIILLICLGILGYRFYQYHQGTSIYNEAENLVNLPDFSDISAADETMADRGYSGNGSNGSNGSDDSGVSNTLDGADGDSSANSPAANDQKLTEATAAAQVAVNPYAKALKNMDFTALRQVNQDVLGWILMPNTVISYPLVQSADNDFYLNRTWNLSSSIVGSIFMDANCSPELSDFNTIIYGHNMNNGSMFGALKKFRTADYWTSHPTFIITNDDGVYTYKIFSAFEADLTDPVFMVRIGREDEKQALIDCAVSKSTIATGIVPTIDDKIVTLSTCTGRGHTTRWILLGVMDSFEPADTPEASTP